MGREEREGEGKGEDHDSDNNSTNYSSCYFNSVYYQLHLMFLFWESLWFSNISW